MGKLAPQKIETVPIGTLKHHPKNPRKGDVKSITESIKHNGFYGVVVAQKSTGYVLAGNHRMMAAKAAGLDSLPVAYVDVDDATALKILLADNRTNDLATYDNKELAELLADVSNTIGLDGTGFDEAFLDGLIGELAQETPAGNADDVPEAQISKADELREKWQTELGQLWEVGRHRILCGDSTDEKQVARLMDGKKALVFTDPPYGIKIVNTNSVGGSGVAKFGKVGGGKIVQSSFYKPVANDNSVEVAEEFMQVCRNLNLTDMIIWGGNYFTDFVAPSRCWIVWDKENTGNFADAELAWTSFDKSVRLYRWLWNGMSRKGDKATEGVSRFHPTQKPVGLHVEILQDFNKEKKPILDGFAGSGTTILACEKYGCDAYGIELDPAYVAVILERLSEMGLEPRLID